MGMASQWPTEKHSVSRTGNLLACKYSQTVLNFLHQVQLPHILSREFCMTIGEVAIIRDACEYHCIYVSILSYLGGCINYLICCELINALPAMSICSRVPMGSQPWMQDASLVC